MTFFEPPKRHAHCVRRQKVRCAQACAYCFFVFPFGAGAQRLLRFGGSKKSVFKLHSTGTASRRQKE
jgi:hypothetical protein